MNNPFRVIPAILFGLLLLFSGCGYRCGNGGALSSYCTITIPYVEGDWNGALTSAIVKEISRSGALAYREEGGALLLHVRILDYYDDHIDFRYDRHKDGKLKKVVIPDETRATIIAEVTVIEAISYQILLGPVRISAEVEYDHDYYSTRDEINVTSLGQLTDIDAAQDASERPLNQRLAKKIVDYVTENW